MRERPENFNAADDESEVTLVTPRFDAEEARRAHPVVPLEQARAPFTHEVPRARRGLRLPWRHALAAVALLAVAAVSGAVATKVLRSPRANSAAGAPAVAAPAQAAEVPAHPEMPPAAMVPRDEGRVKRQTPPRERGDRAANFQAESLRSDDDEFEGKDEGRLGKGKGRRRSRAEDEAEKEARKVLKRAKGKAPRLVDVLVSP